MELDEKTITRISVLAIILFLGVLAFFIVKPVLLSVIGGLLLAYIFYPVFAKVNLKIKNKTLAASIVSIFIVLILAVPLWFIIPLFVQQAFQVYVSFQNFDSSGIVKALFPAGTEQFTGQTIAVLNSFVSKIVAGVFSSLGGVLLELPIILLHLFVISFIFFFALRDGDKLKQYMVELSPLHKNQEKILVSQFKGITDSIVYGQIIVGIVQGMAAGLGFLMFGVDKALLLTVLAIFLSVIPMIGPAIIWIPVAIVMLAQGNAPIALAFIVYNVLIVSTIDNVIRTYLIVRRSESQTSTVVVLLGMIGGLFVFNILGLILGPLILTYFLTFLKAYKDRAVATLFRE